MNQREKITSIFDDHKLTPEEKRKLIEEEVAGLIVENAFILGELTGVLHKIIDQPIIAHADRQYAKERLEQLFKLAVNRGYM